MSVNYNNLKDLFALDPRIGQYGTMVPGPDNKFGFGLSCLPKECRGMTKLLETLGIDNTVFEQITYENDLLRKL
jgi:UDP-glucose 6-dehydrogenase